MPDNDEIKAKELYDLKLHEWVYYDKLSLTIIRVPGGWLYDSSRNGYTALTFVPWNNEFQPKE